VRRRIALTLAVLCGALAASLVTSPPAEAHPLGNFTINRYAGIEVAGRDVYVRYALDVAEIPTYQLGGELQMLAEQLRLLTLERLVIGRRPSLCAWQPVMIQPGFAEADHFGVPRQFT